MSGTTSIGITLIAFFLFYSSMSAYKDIDIPLPIEVVTPGELDKILDCAAFMRSQECIDLHTNFNEKISNFSLLNHLLTEGE